MKAINIFLMAVILCVSPAGTGNQVRAQDASNPQTARSKDSSDWGLLGLIGLIGLLGMRKKDREEE